ITYDAMNRRATVSNASLVLTYRYDNEGKVLSVADQDGNTAGATYDIRHSPSSRTWTGPQIGSARIDLAYDGEERLSTIRRSLGIAGANTIGSTTWTYDTRGRVAQIRHANGASTSLASYVFSYDNAGELTGSSDHGQTMTFGYDP